MGTLNEDLESIKTVESKITRNPVARFSYTEEAYTTNDADGVAEYNVNNAQNIPTADPLVLKVNETVLSKGWRAQASSITRMLMNHFLGRLSYNLNKVNDNMANLLATLTSHLGTANGFASLDENGRVPYSQLPESAMELKGEWNADTNTPHLKDGVGLNGDFYTVKVGGTVDFGHGEIQFFENDRVIYYKSTESWGRLSAGDVKTVNSKLPTNGNVALTGENIPVSTEDDTPLSEPATENRIADNAVTVKKLNLSFAGVLARNPRWLQFAFTAENKQTLKICADTHIRVGNKVIHFDTDTFVDLSERITENGKDYYVFLDEEGTITASTIKTEAEGTKRIGQFHTLCEDVGANVTAKVPTELTATNTDFLIKQYDEETEKDFFDFYNKKITAISTGSYYNVGTVAHPLSGFSKNDILPESVWCLTFHPDCSSYDGMIFDRDTNIAVDIYLQSGKGKATRSAFGAVHTVSRQQWNHQEDMRAVGKRLLKDFEFTSVASGSNETTNIVGSSDKTTVGGHSDTAGRRMVSFVGAEECCGYLWQWIDELAPIEGSSWSSDDGQGSFGQGYGTPYCLIAGGLWLNGTSCGSRSRSSVGVRSSVRANIGARGSAGVIRHA